MDDADGGNGKYECAGTQESRKRDKLLQFTLLLKNGLVHAMRSTGPHQPSFPDVPDSQTRNEPRFNNKQRFDYPLAELKINMRWHPLQQDQVQ